MERFQTSLNRTLVKEASDKGIWLWHPPDGLGLWRPGDWLFGQDAAWGCIEAKQVRTPTFPKHDWTPQQRQACLNIEKAGGIYWLVVCFNYGRHDMLALAYVGTLAREILEAFGNLDSRRDPSRKRYQSGMRVLFHTHGDRWENAYALFTRPHRSRGQLASPVEVG